MGPIQLLVFGIPVVVAIVAYLLPGVRVMRSIAGVLCILVAAAMAFIATEAGQDEQLQVMAMVVVLVGLVIAVRPERTPKAPAAAVPYGQPGPARPQPYPQQPQSPPQHAPTQQPPGYSNAGGQP